MALVHDLALRDQAWLDQGGVCTITGVRVERSESLLIYHRETHQVVSLIGGMLRDPEVMELAILEGLDGALGLVPDLARNERPGPQNHLMAVYIGVLLDLVFQSKAEARISALKGLLAVQSWRRNSGKNHLHEAMGVSRRNPESVAKRYTSDRLTIDGHPVAIAVWPEWLDTLLDSPNQWVLLAKEALQPGLLTSENATCLNAIRVTEVDTLLQRISLDLQGSKDGGNSPMNDLQECARVLNWAPRLFLPHDDGMVMAHMALKLDLELPPFGSPYWPAFGGDPIQAIHDYRQADPAADWRTVMENQLLNRRGWCLPARETCPWVDMLKAHGASEADAWQISVSLAVGWREALAGCMMDLSLGVGPNALHLDEGWRNWARETWAVS